MEPMTKRDLSDYHLESKLVLVERTIGCGQAGRCLQPRILSVAVPIFYIIFEQDQQSREARSFFEDPITICAGIFDLLGVVGNFLG
jgi:hypothetical protein